MESSVNNNFKGYRFVSVQNSPSFIANNLTTNDGESFVYACNTEGNPRAIIFGKDLVEKGEIAQPQVL